MEIIEVQDYEEMSQKAAQIIISKVIHNPEMVIGFATGGTPKGTYRHLIEDHQKNGTSYSRISSVNLDEYAGLEANSPNSYRYYMNHSLFNHLDINMNQTHVPNGTAKQLEEECRRYDGLIDELGGVDLQILGMGVNGHIGFNEPGTSFTSPTHVVELAESTRKANARYFESLEDVPTHAVTMGIGTIMKSKHILLLVSGNEKAEALANLQKGAVTEEVPATILNHHPQVTVIADKQALSQTWTRR
ncbi:glucosamine-6-phosphate deaminase [Metabacillus sp. 84]|uniref:glucosamine-6-phosphate deaminase n=1 Tax=Metabacillus sp. 84 TaxID=3404705 RepID=UPI003CF570A4